MLHGKKIILGISGSIAAYKAVLLLRLLQKQGGEVKVIMTPAATDFVSPLTFSSLNNNEVMVNLFENNQWQNHALLGRWADMMLIAPASANTLAKMANGLCDNLLLAVYLSAACPVMVVPAMDEDMWLHPVTQNNLQILKSNGTSIIPVEEGLLASGLVGKGRLAEPEAIIQHLTQYFDKKADLKGRKILVTAGPTYEAIDPVRFIGNHSSGKMGIALAEECSERGAEVTLVLGPSTETTAGNMKMVKVTSAEEMYVACMQNFNQYDIIIMAAAVADYTPQEPSSVKLKKREEDMNLHLKRTRDILAEAGGKKSNGQLLIGFALETDNELQHAREKLHSKNLDMIILNSLQDKGAGFGTDTNKVTILKKGGSTQEIPLLSKKEIAKEIINTISPKP